MNDVIEFVRARLDDEVRIADAAAEAFLHGDRIGIDPYTMHPSVRMHVYSWTPARVLREVESKRNVLALLAPPVDPYELKPPCCEQTLELVVRRMATAWDSHPAYDEAWRP